MPALVNQKRAIEFLEGIENKHKRAFIQIILEEVLRSSISWSNETEEKVSEKRSESDVDMLFIARVVNNFLNNKSIHSCDGWIESFFLSKKNPNR